MKTTLKAAALVLASFAVTATPSVAMDNPAGYAQAKIQKILNEAKMKDTNAVTYKTKRATKQQRVISTSMPLSSVERAQRNLRATQRIQVYGR